MHGLMIQHGNRNLSIHSQFAAFYFGSQRKIYNLLRGKIVHLILILRNMAPSTIRAYKINHEF